MRFVNSTATTQSHQPTVYFAAFIVSNKTFSWMNWLNEILVSIDLNNLLEKEAHQLLAEIFNNTSEQLADPNAQLLAGDCRR